MAIATLHRLSTAPTLDPRTPVVIYAADEWGGVGGTAGYILMVARGLRKRGYRTAAICHNTPGVARLRDQLASMGVEVRTLPGDDRGSAVSKLRRFGWYRDLFRDYPRAIMLMLMGYHTRGGNAILAARLAGARGIVRADLTPPEPPIRFRERMALRLKDMLVSRVVVGAGENIDAFASLMGRSTGRMSVIHTGIELDRFEPGAGRSAVRGELGYTADDQVIGTLSRLDDERKGVSYFLEMAGRVAARDPRARFLVVGDGILRQGLEQRARELGVGDRVTFAGWRADAARIFAAMDVFVMPSLYEGGPTTVLEAMAMARPVVATRVGMVPEVIANGETGLIVPVRDSAALASAVERLLADNQLRQRIGQNARHIAVESFSVDRMVERYLELSEAC